MPFDCYVHDIIKSHHYICSDFRLLQAHYRSFGMIRDTFSISWTQEELDLPLYLLLPLFIRHETFVSYKEA